MARYATGKKSKAISDITGFKINYPDLKTTWDGLRVEADEYDAKHPQLTPAKNVIDATALFNPRPDTDQEITNVVLGYNYDPFIEKVNRPSIGIEAVGGVGRLNTAPAGDRATSAIGFESAIVETGLAGTFSIGQIQLDNEVVASGIAGTSAVGTEAIVADMTITETGVAGTSAVGTETLECSITEAGLEATGEIGTETPLTDHLTWGKDGWGENAWGQ